MSTYRGQLLVLLATVLMALGLTACGDSDASDPEAGSTGGSPTDSSPVDASATDASATEAGSPGLSDDDVLAGQTIKLGLMMDRSGPNSAGTEPHRTAARLFERYAEENDVFGGADMEIVPVDSGGEGATAVAAARELVAEDVAAVVGPAFSAEALAAGPVFQEAGIPFLAPISVPGAVETIGDMTFVTILPVDALVPRVVDEYLEAFPDTERVAVYHASDVPFAVAGAGLFEASFEAAGAEVVASESHLLSDTDFRSTLTKIVEADPDVLILYGLLEDAQIMRQAREVGLDPDVRFLGDQSFTQPKLWELAGEVGDGSLWGATWHPDVESDRAVTEWFVEAYVGEFGEQPEHYPAAIFESFMLLSRAAEEAATTTDSQAIADALRAVSIDGIRDSGMSFNADTQVLDLPVVLLERTEGATQALD